MSARAIALRKQDLAIQLQTIQPHPKPKVDLEQYTVPANLAADILFRACYAHNDIEDKSITDLGTGTGRLAIGASLLGAKHTIGVDLDSTALKIAADNARRLGLHIDWVLGDVQLLRGRVDAVVMNPPFGTREQHADTHFLEVALGLAGVVYSIHKSSTRTYLGRWLNRRDTDSSVMFSSKMEIAHQFPFHRKRRHYVDVDVYRIVRR